MQETTDTTTPNTPAAPRTDRLELVKELGRGSIGVVHKANSPQQGRVSALRQFEVPQWLDDVNELLNRILGEARAASMLDHPNIARLYTCGYKGFTVFMTSEFVEGQSLKEILSTRQPEMAEVLSWSKQLLAALDYAHDKGVFHHFLNPSNIKILPDGTLKILDFGLLRDKHLLSQTPAKKLENEPYLSPEEIKNKPPDRGANLFTSATIIYQLYTCRNPFAGKHLGEVDRAIMDVTPHPLNTAHPRVPPAISTVVLKALSKNRVERFQSGKQMIAALEEAIKAAPLVPPPAPKPVAPKPAAPEPESFNGTATPAKAAPLPAASKTQVLPPPPATARVQVGTTNHWKLAGAVATCLVVVAVLAFLFQRKPAENTIETTEADAPKAAPRAPAPAPTPVATPVAEPVAEVTEPEPATVDPVMASVRRSRPVRVRAPRAANSAAPAASPQEGEISIASVPADATVEIEGFAGQSWKTPQTLTAVPAGNYRVTISKPGYAPDVRNVQIAAGGHLAVDVRLTVVKGWLTVAGSPAGASVVIDGQDTGKVTPVTLMLDPASHQVLLRKSGYLEVGSAVQLVAGQTVSYSPTLMVAGRTDNIKIMGGGIGKVFGGAGGSQGRARIEIKTEPKGAQVLINGTPLQKTTPVEIQVEAGNYDITLQKDGYKDIHESAIVGIDDKIKISRTLAR